MVGGQQLIRLSTGADKSTVIHEIGHAVGLMHEQTRTDRDQYINIDFSNINNDWKDQYKTYDVLGRSGFQIGTFDYNSVMLYPSSVPEARVGSNTSPQMTRKNGTTWGYNSYISQGDIDGVNYLYSPSVYARISVVYDDVNSYSNIDDARQIYINKAEFFSDASYTTKVVLQKPIELKYIYTQEEIGRTTEINESRTVIAPAGANEVYLGESRDEYRLDYGNYVFHFISSYQIKKWRRL